TLRSYWPLGYQLAPTFLLFQPLAVLPETGRTRLFAGGQRHLDRRPLSMKVKDCGDDRFAGKTRRPDAKA
ncbi:hypothetical protein ACNJUL_21040, partial [Mycobacterium tuberculosis]